MHARYRHRRIVRASRPPTSPPTSSPGGIGRAADDIVTSNPARLRAGFDTVIGLALAAVTIDIVAVGQTISRNQSTRMTPTISRLALAAFALSASIMSAGPAPAAVACGS